MTKHFISIVFLATSGMLCASSTTQPDSITVQNRKQTVMNDTIKTKISEKQEKVRDLREVVVEAATRKDIAGGVAFFPTKREKNLATDAISLIANLALTELYYDPAKNRILTLDDQGVTYFIDGKKAASNQLTALNPKDVARIEYLPMPVDARFGEALNVVNFVMKKYEYGGYTKFYAQQNLEGIKGDYSLSSKFAYKEMTFDAIVAGGYLRDHKLSGITTKEMRDITYNGQNYLSVTQTGAYENGINDSENMGALFQANWMHGNIDLTAQGVFNRAYTPRRSIFSTTLYDPEIINSRGYETFSKELSLSPEGEISMNLSLPKSQTLSTSLSWEHGAFKNGSRYMPENLDEIWNFSRDHNQTFGATASYSIPIKKKHSFGASILYVLDWGHTFYEGSYNNIADYNSNRFHLFLRYGYTFSKSTSISTTIGVSVSHSDIQDNKTDEVYPRFNLNFRHRWNPKSSFSLSSILQDVGYPLTSKNEVIMRVNELTWQKGNPDLKSRLQFNNSISNTWTMSRKLTLSATLRYNIFFNKDFKIWEILNGYDGLVTSKSDRNTSHRISMAPRIVWRLFNRKLVFTGTITGSYYKVNGYYDFDYLGLSGSMTATWYGNNWYARVTYMPAYTGQSSLEKIYHNTYYQLKGGYTYKKLNMTLSLTNFFINRHGDSRISIITPHYIQRSMNSDGFNSNVATFTLTYTFGYGKKIDENDVYKSDGGQSNAMTIEY